MPKCVYCKGINRDGNANDVAVTNLYARTKTVQTSRLTQVCEVKLCSFSEQM